GHAIRPLDVLRRPPPPGGFSPESAPQCRCRTSRDRSVRRSASDNRTRPRGPLASDRTRRNRRRARHARLPLLLARGRCGPRPGPRLASAPAAWATVAVGGGALAAWACRAAV